LAFKPIIPFDNLCLDIWHFPIPSIAVFTRRGSKDFEVLSFAIYFHVIDRLSY